MAAQRRTRHGRSSFAGGRSCGGSERALIAAAGLLQGCRHVCWQLLLLLGCWRGLLGGRRAAARAAALALARTFKLRFCTAGLALRLHPARVHTLRAEKPGLSPHTEPLQGSRGFRNVAV